MMKVKNLISAVVIVTLTFAVGAVQAQTTLPETVPVGGSPNKADTTGFGAVAYAYKIGKYEVTNAEFAAFLNAANKTNTHKLYDVRMAGEYGGITRSGDAGSYTYSVKDGWGKKPVNYVTWETAVRYANWLTNGEGKGDTETGSYTIKDGKVTVPDHAKLAAGKETKWVLPSEDEWYKAAYYDPNKTGGAGYWKYPAKSDDAPTANINTNAPSDVGSHAKAVSPYGTYDQGGNMWEYNESRKGGKVGLRGGSFYINDNESYLRSATRYDVLSAKWPNYGFRVAALGGAAAK
ncbi:MAG: PEP-CTERM sorting domain-containing protein [Gemmataceae bacterium]|nr:PEP-CTERM sorting domain-containing protein [Gemmataceae bacterium]